MNIKFVEGEFEKETIITDVVVKKLEIQDPINFAEKDLSETFDILNISKIDYQNYLNDNIDEIKLDYIKKNLMLYKNKWPLLKKQETTLFKIPPPLQPLGRIKLF